MKPKLTIAQQIAHMKDKGIQFSLISEEEARDFITINTYYFKIKAYAKNYEKYPAGEHEGQYKNLDFAYLKELSTLDMHLRRSILDITLYIEHCMKTKINRALSDNVDEDGYKLARSFLIENDHAREELENKARESSPYTIDLLRKYDGQHAIWSLMELISFGDFIKLYKKYYQYYDIHLDEEPFLFLVKSLRNAAAHNNCLLNNLKKINHCNFTPNKKLNHLMSQIPGIISETRRKKMSHPVIHDFAAVLVVADTLVRSKKARRHIADNLSELITRFFKRIDFFEQNNVITSHFEFLKKIIDEFVKRLYN